jgi:hypothetical protein
VIRIINPPQSVDKCFNALRVPRLDIAADTHILKLQLMQNRVLRTIGNSPRRAPIPDLHMAFRLPYVYDFIAKLCRRLVEVKEMKIFVSFGQDDVKDRKNGGLNFAAVKLATSQTIKLQLHVQRSKQDTVQYECYSLHLQKPSVHIACTYHCKLCFIYVFIFPSGEGHDNKRVVCGVTWRG